MRDAKLREQVRKIWSSEDPSRKLFESLLLDYATEGVFQGPSLDSWELGSDLQTEAAMRLLYYYPKQTAEMISDRLRRLDVKEPSDNGGVDAFIRREVANGVRTAGFVEAVSWCTEPAIREAIRTIFETTSDTSVLLAALPGIPDADQQLIFNRLQSFLDRVPGEERGAFGDVFKLLEALAERLDKNARPAFERVLKDASPLRCYSVAEALHKTKAEWSLGILRRLLDDKRRIQEYTYQVHQKSGRRLAIRVCDAAAEILPRQYPELRFALEGEYEELDKQVNAIRAQLDQRAQ
jgi:hypothetical protein